MELKAYGVGIATTDSEMRPLGTSSVANVSLAFNKSYKDKDGAWQKEVSFVKCQIFGPRAEKFAQFVKKGVPVFVEGYIKQDSWTSTEGDKRTVLVLTLNSFEVVQKTNGETVVAASVEKEVAPAPAPAPPQNKKTKPTAVKSQPQPEPVTVPSEAEENEEIPF
jgi:single-strand DNA-binding protein